MLNREPIEQVRDANTFEEMRAEIARLRRYDALVRQATDAADYKGLSAEDRYTMLAYCALKAKCFAQAQIYEYALTTVQPMIFTPNAMYPAKPAE